MIAHRILSLFAPCLSFLLTCSRVVMMASMAMWICDIENCGKSSVRTEGECILCNRHLCARHLDPEHHTCPKWEVSISATDGASRFTSQHLALYRMKKPGNRLLEKQNGRKSMIFCKKSTSLLYSLEPINCATAFRAICHKTSTMTDQRDLP